MTTTISTIKHRININNSTCEAATQLQLNDIGVCNLSLNAELVFDPYEKNRATGSFILIDRTTNATIAAGMIDHSLRRSTNINWQSFDIGRQQRAELKNQKPVVVWFTGLSGSGKSTIANQLERRLFRSGKHSIVLDGDNVRHGLNRDLGFTEAARVENIRRVVEVAKLMTDAGLIVIVSFISPFEAERRFARDILEEGEFVEVFVDTPIEICAKRDPKGLYARAHNGEIKNFTGIDSPYEEPKNPDIRLSTTDKDPFDLAIEIEEFLAAKEYF